MKRFTETEKWTDRWFRALPLDRKLAWLYLCDNCDSSGVWDPDFELADFKIGTSVSWDEFKHDLGDRLNLLANGKWHLIGFISFQQRELSHNKPAHKQIFRLLDKHGIPIPYISHSNGIAMPISHSHSKGISNSKGKVKKEVVSNPEAIKVLEKLNETVGSKFRMVPSSLKLISERLSEGFTVNDCFAVIAMKAKNWMAEEKSREWLNPHTLFRKEKFPEYVGQLGISKLQDAKPSYSFDFLDKNKKTT